MKHIHDAQLLIKDNKANLEKAIVITIMKEDACEIKNVIVTVKDNQIQVVVE